MLLTEKISLIILGLTMGAQVFRRSLLVQYVKSVWRLSVLGIFGILGYWTYLHYETWSANSFTKAFLPPYQSFGYFYSYVGSRLVAPWLIALLAAYLVSGIAARLNKRFGGRFFEEEEVRFISLGTFLSGYPGFLFYLIFVLSSAVILSFFYTSMGRGRAPLYYLWLPLAIFAIIVKNWLLPGELLSQFNL